jgi:predicted outer membrane repeat protein
VRGCTFYNNTAYTGGAIYGGTITLTGNLFFGNTATHSGGTVYNSSVTSGGYNVSDKNAGTGQANSSGYTGSAVDQFNKDFLLISPTFKAVKSGAAAGVLTTLPENYPEYDFYGQSIPQGGAAGAVQALTKGPYLDCGVNNNSFGKVTFSTAPDEDGCYTSGTSVTLTAAASEGISPASAFSHWDLGGTTESSNPYAFTMDASKTVRAVFVRNITVSDTSDGEGSANTAGTLRYALNNAQDGDIISLPANQTITLTAILPEITTGITIAGNGATLTQSGIASSTKSQLLRISASGKAVKISRLHFTGARASSAAGGGLSSTNADLTLESCIFSDNNSSIGGAIFYSGNLIVLGCTFYANTAISGGAIYLSGGTLTLTGNLFSGNTASSSGNVVYGTVADISSGGYNVSNNAAVTGTTVGSGSGYAGNANSTDLFSVTDITFASAGNPTTKPSSNSSLKTLTGLPGDFPTTYFDGTSRNIPATAGAVASD